MTAELTPADAVREALDRLDRDGDEHGAAAILRPHIAALTARVAELEARCRPVPLSSVEVIVGERGDTVLTVSTTADEIRQFHRLAALAGAGPVACDTTERLVSLLRSRDALGRKKYGTSLDRADLTAAEWLQHLTEELLDAAGYAQSLIRANAPAKAREDVDRLVSAARGVVEMESEPRFLHGEIADLRAALATFAEGG